MARKRLKDFIIPKFNGFKKKHIDNHTGTYKVKSGVFTAPGPGTYKISSSIYDSKSGAYHIPINYITNNDGLFGIDPAGYWDWKEDNKMKWKDFEQMGRSGYGERNWWSEYAVQGEYLYVYTTLEKPEWPVDYPLIEETAEVMLKDGNKAIYKIAIAT